MWLLSAAAYQDVGEAKLSGMLFSPNLLRLDQREVPLSIHFRAKEPARITQKSPIILAALGN